MLTGSQGCHKIVTERCSGGQGRCSTSHVAPLAHTAVPEQVGCSWDHRRQLRGEQPAPQKMLRAWGGAVQPLLPTVAPGRGRIRAAPGREKHEDPNSQATHTSCCTRAQPEVIGKVLKNVSTQELLTFNCEFHLDGAHETPKLMHC